MGVADGQICRILLQARADAMAANDDGQNVLMPVLDSESCRLLLKAGAQADAVDRFGLGILQHAAIAAQMGRGAGSMFRVRINDTYDRNLSKTFRQLISAGADSKTEINMAMTHLSELLVPNAIQVLEGALTEQSKRKR